MKQHIAIIVVVLLAFGLIVSITGFLGKYIGKSGEQIVLGVIALMLFVFLILDKGRKE